MRDMTSCTILEVMPAGATLLVVLWFSCRWRRFDSMPLGSLADQRIRAGVVDVPIRPPGRRIGAGAPTDGATPSVTTSFTEVVRVSPPPTPVTVSGYVPVGVTGLTFDVAIVSVDDEPPAGLGANATG